MRYLNRWRMANAGSSPPRNRLGHRLRRGAGRLRLAVRLRQRLQEINGQFAVAAPAAAGPADPISTMSANTPTDQAPGVCRVTSTAADGIATMTTCVPPPDSAAREDPQWGLDNCRERTRARTARPCSRTFKAHALRAAMRSALSSIGQYTTPNSGVSGSSTTTRGRSSRSGRPPSRSFAIMTMADVTATPLDLKTFRAPSRAR